MGSKSGSKRFYTDYHLTIGYGWALGPVDRFNSIIVGEKFATNGTAEQGGEVLVNLEDHFGGIDKQGGLRGRIFFYMGALGQTLNSWLAGRLGRTPTTISGDGGIATTWFTHTLQDPVYNRWNYPGFVWQTNNPVIPAVWAEIARAPKVLDPDLAMIPRADLTIASVQVLDISAEPGGGGAAHNAADAIAQDIGVLLSGFSPYDVLRITEPAGETFVAWSPWGVPAYSGVDTGTSNSINVIRDENPAKESGFGTKRDPATYPAVGAWDGYEQARENFGSFTFTGGSTYRFYIKDNPIGDNTGGLSIRVERLAGLDANPSHIIYELLTVVEQGGLGIDPMLIDTAAFDALAQLMVDERFGLSFKWKEEKDVEAVINEVLNHIDAVFYPDRSSGLLTVKAIRDDYDVGTLFELTDDNFTATQFSRKGLGEMINQVIVNYTDPDTEETSSVPPAQDLGLIAAQGDIVSDSRNYYMVRSRDKAQELAYRDLRVASSPLATVEGEANRQAWDLVPGQVVKFSSAKLGITDLILRVFEVDYGRPGSDAIKLSMTEDIFAQPTQAFEPPPVSEADPDAEPPTPVDVVKINTLSYYFTVQFLPSEVLQDLVRPNAFCGIFAAEPGADTYQFDLWSEESTPLGGFEYQFVSRMVIMARGSLRDGLVQANTTAGVVIENYTQGAEPVVGGFVLIGDGDEDEVELAIVTAVNADPLGLAPTELTLQRGVLDTVPRIWPAGAPVFAVNTNAIFADPNVRDGLTSQNYKLLSVTSLGILPIDQAPVETKLVSERPWLPSRPANVTVNGEGFQSANCVGVDPIPIAWSNRNRLTEDSQILQWTDGDVTGEVGQTTRVTAYDADGVELGHFGGLIGTSYNLDPAIFAGASSGYVGVRAELGGDLSLQEYRLPVILIGGYGYNYGWQYGKA